MKQTIKESILNQVIPTHQFLPELVCKLPPSVNVIRIAAKMETVVA